MNKNDNMLQEMKQVMENLERLAKENPEEAKRQARESLIRCGLLNEDGSSKEHIVTESHIGYEEEELSYESVVASMKECMSNLRDLGDGDYEKTRHLIAKSLVDSCFVDQHGHIIVHEKRAPHVEAFFKRMDDQMNTLGRQRVRK